jgi:amino acid transporter
MGVVHGVHKTPYFAVYMSALVTLIIVVPLAIGQGFLNGFGLTGTIATYGFVVVYFGVCVTAPVDMYKGGSMKVQHLIFGIVGAALMAFVVYASLFPYPAAPFNWLPPLFVIYLVIGLIWFLVLKSKSPQVLASIANDMEG